MLAYPVRDNRGFANGALGFVVNLMAFNAMIAKAVQPEAVTALVDYEDTLIARSTEAEKWVGKRLRELPLFNEILTRRKGEVISKGIDGVERLPPRARMICYIYPG